MHFGVIAGNVGNLATMQQNAKVIPPWQIKIKPTKVKLTFRHQNQLDIPPYVPSKTSCINTADNDRFPTLTRSME